MAEQAATEKKLEELENERLAKISAVKELGKELDRTLTELAQNTSRYEALKQLEDSYQGFHQGVREVMKAVKNKRFNHIHGVLAQLIEIDSEYEKAIESALAGHLQDLVADDAKSARTAIEYLKSQKLGRATFLPLDLIELRPVHLRILSAVTQPGVVGIAAKLVSCSSEIQPAVDFLLGKILVVESLEIAEKMLRSGLKTRYVSLDGDSLTDRGLMSGGFIRSSGLLSREREIRKLQQRIKELKQIEANGAPRLALLRQQRLELEDQVFETTEALNNLKVLVAQGQSALQSEEDFFKERQRQADELAAEQRSLRDNRVRLQEQIEQDLKQIEELRGKSAGLRNELEEVESGGIAIDTDESGEIRNAYAEAMRELTAARERAAALRDKKQATEESAGRLRERVNQKLSEVEQLNAQQEAAQKDQETARSELDSKTEAVEALAKEIAGQAQIKEKHELTIRQLDNEIQEAVRDEREAQNELQERQIEQAQLESSVQHLDERALERFNRPLSEVAGEAEECEMNPEELAAQVAQLREKRDSMGEINNSAIDEHTDTKERYDQYLSQYNDLVASRESLLRTIRKIDATALEKFQEAFAAIRLNFHDIFRQLFGGGKADLLLTDPDDPLGSGIDIVAMPPGSQVRNIMLQSGGEKSMVAVALLFAIFKHKPSPFCVLDEIDHALDDRNIGRFKDMVTDFAEKTQFVIITHNKLTMELSDTLYGVTMEEKGVTKLVSVQFNDLQLVG